MEQQNHTEQNQRQQRRHEQDQRQRRPEHRRDKADGNTVFVGKKPSMSYVLAVVMQFGNGKNEVHLRARGRAISKAVDVAEIVRNKFVQDAKVGNIKIGTEEVKSGDEKLNISTMEITLRKGS